MYNLVSLYFSFIRIYYFIRFLAIRIRKVAVMFRKAHKFTQARYKIIGTPRDLQGQEQFSMVLH